MIILTRKIDEVDAFSALTPKNQVIESYQISNEISHIEIEYMSYCIVEMSPVDILAIPKDAIQK